MFTQLPTVAMNDFARRQTPESAFSHYEGSFDALCGMVALVMTDEGTVEVLSDDEDGQVIKVTVDASGFYTPVVVAEDGMEFVTRFAVRDRAVDGEHPYISTRAKGGKKMPATSASIICYSNSKLARKGENSTDAEWEIVSINAQRDDGSEPPHPVTILRNARDYPGGTKTTYTVDQMLDSIEYWLGGGPNPPHIMLDCEG